jgi:Na+-translocating ferredoxin:NAD+ oxidoreductase RnfG subunit
MLTIKYLMFLALELSVFIVIGAVLVAGLYQIVRDKVRESRLFDQVNQTSPVARHQS